MLRQTVSVVSVFVLGLALAPPAWAQDVPFVGVVTQDGVKVRAGAGRAYYVVGELDQGAIVQVDEVIFGWNKIVPPEGFYSYIPEGFVSVKGAGQTGTIIQDRSEVKAGSVKGPGESYRGQVALNRGDTVQILALEGGYYKIVPPKGTYVYLPPGSVNRATPEQIAAAQQAQAQAQAQNQAQPQPQPQPEPELAAAQPQPTPAPPTQAQAQPQPPAAPTTPSPEVEEIATAIEPTPEPAAPTIEPAPTETAATEPVETTAPTAALPPAEQPQPEPTVQPEAGQARAQAQPEPAEDEPVMSKAANFHSAAVSDKLRALENRMVPLFFKPLEQQPIDEMIREYEAIQREPLPAIDRQIVKMRLAALQRNKDIAQTLAQIQEATSSTPTQVDVPQPEPGAPLRYDAVGRLLASSVYDGTSLPRMFRVVDPATGRTIVWVEPGGPVDAKQYLGKVVGVIGAQSYDPALKFNVVDVQRIDVLEAQSAATTQ